MDDARFHEAERFFAAKDYRAAAEGFLAAAGGPGGAGNGAAYHMAGNSLMRLRKYQHAVTVYTHAMRDETYAKRTSVMLNLGTAQAAQGAYAEAVAAFDVALADPGYPKRFKALQGRAGALYKMGRFEEAARDYRAAAAEPGNPDRGKAFNNLGLALSALGRPAEAVEAYKAAIASEEYTGKGRAAVNLGLAYAALGMPAEAVAGFEMATHGYGHQLSPAALDAYEAARVSAGQAPRHEAVEEFRIGEMAQTAAGVAVPDPPAGDPPVVPEAPESAFFTRTESEMKELDRETRRQERQERRGAANPWARAAGGALAVVIVVAAFVGVFFAGYGFPTQRGTVGGMLQSYKDGRPVTDYWIADAKPSDVTKEMATIPATFRSATVDSIEQTAFDSKVTVTVKLDKGAPLHYRISLGREGVGWKVVGVDNDWGSTNGD